MYWDEKDEEQLVSAVLSEYNLRQIKKIKKTELGYKIITEKGPKHLKKYEGEQAGIIFLRKATEHLARQGFRRINRFILSKYGDPFLRLGNCYWYLTDWREGKECDFDKLPQLDLAVKTLAQFHQAASGLECTAEEAKDFGSFKEQLERRCQRLEDWGALARGGEIVNSLQLGLRLWAQIDLEQMKEAARTAGHFAHGAYGEKALLRLRDAGMFIVREESLRREMQVYDLGRLLVRYLPGYKWDLYVGKLLLDLYDAYRPLTNGEWKIIMAYLAFPLRKYRLIRKYQTELVFDENSLALKLQEETELERLKWEFIRQINAEREIGLEF